MGVRCVSVLALLACLCGTASALWFHVLEGSPRCFIEEVPDDTLVVGKAKNPDFVPWGEPNFTGVGLRVTVQTPKGDVMLNKNLERESRFAFTSTEGGEYVVCFATNSSRWFGGQQRKFRVDLKFEVGDSNIDFAQVAKKEHLDSLEVEIRRLRAKMDHIIKEYEYQQEREETFRNTSESTNARVQWWSIIQSTIMVSAGVWQVLHLRSFFMRKKLM